MLPGSPSNHWAEPRLLGDTYVSMRQSQGRGADSERGSLANVTSGNGIQMQPVYFTPLFIKFIKTNLYGNSWKWIRYSLHSWLAFLVVHDHFLNIRYHGTSYGSASLGAQRRDMLALGSGPPATSNAALWETWWPKWCARYGWHFKRTLPTSVQRPGDKHKYVRFMWLLWN